MITSNREHKIINGFTRPKHPFQVFTMIFFIQLMCCVSIAIVPITELIVQIILASFFYFLALMIFIYAFKTSYIDPTDDLIIQQRSGLNIALDQELYDYFCQFCDSYVSGTTKHCKVCERQSIDQILRCVSDFDHHCKWLNNCVGKKNYQEFFKLLVFVSLFGITFIIFAIFSYCFQSPRMMIWIWINVGLVGLLFLLNFNLMIFHFWLKFKGITTYSWIMQNRQKKFQQQVQIETPPRFWQLSFLSNIISCSQKKIRKAQVNPNLEQEQEQEQEEDENQKQKIEMKQNDEQSQIKQQNVEIEGDSDSVQDKNSKRKCSSHTINPQINSQIQD